MIPFIMFGIGLDDAFIIFGSYRHRSHIKDIKERVQSTMEDVGVSIFLTTLTSMLAFLLGSMSSIPFARWLCYYAFPCIGVDFFYQVTFFIALVTLDERRIEQGRMDYCTCIYVDQSMGEEDVEKAEPDGVVKPEPEDDQQSIHIADRIMMWWAEQLLKKWVQVLAMMGFASLFIVSLYYTSKLRQEFDFTDMVPEDSYVRSYYGALDAYSAREGEMSHIYFRDVDFSDPTIQTQMVEYIDDLMERGNVDEPVYFWLYDFRKFMGGLPEGDSLHNVTFEEQIEKFLQVDVYRELYDQDIGRQKDGSVTETRVEIHIRVNVRDLKATTDMLANLREISGSQPINQGLEEWKFFTYTHQYNLYE